MNVLITSAAAKVLLVQAFTKASVVRGGKVFTTDLQSTCAAACFSAGHFAVQRIDQAGAIEQIEEICASNAIRLIVPTRDGELSFFARHKERLRADGIVVLVPDQQVLDTCQDKRRFGARLREVGLPAIPEFDAAHIPKWPVFVRPAIGAGGRGAAQVNRASNLPDNIESYLVHPLIAAREYSIDLLMDLTGQRAVQAVVRERLQIVSGESKVSTVVQHPALAAATMQLGAQLGLVGHNTVQAFDDAERGIMFIEVNPRFGGASNCSIIAGLDSPDRILAMLADDPSAFETRPVRYGLTMLRYSQDVFVEAAP